MRIFLTALLLAASPALARADLDLRLDWPVQAAGPSIRIDVPDLSVGGVAAGDLLLARDGRGYHYARVEPALCLVLGIIPGFGIGHLLAGSDRWVVWLVVDVVIAAVFWGPFWYWPDHPGYFPALSLLVLVERIFEGVLAYQAAGGGRVFRMDRGLADVARMPPPPALAAIPVTPRNGLF
ncbi:MAG TPA: hypothetical protein VLD85_06140 [Anaeromyxobacteraceae bacterium]|nr:hypothetical protein [Anaeromyxobacteraceae bacterium]